MKCIIVKESFHFQAGKGQLILQKNQNVYIQVGILHQMENIGDDMVEFVETQIGNYLGEDDFGRI